MPIHHLINGQSVASKAYFETINPATQQVLAEASLSYLGLGPPVPYTWGALLTQGTNYFWTTPHLLLVPGLAIALMVLGCNLLGDGLRDYLDPRREFKRR